MSPQFYSHVYQSFSLGSLYPWTLSLMVTNTDTVAQGSEGADVPIYLSLSALMFAVGPELLPHLTAAAAPTGLPLPKSSSSSSISLLSSWKK